MKIKLMENFRAVFYAPYYATYALGFYKKAGVDVELISSAKPGDAVPGLLDGSVDITWGGPMRTMKAHDQDSTSPLISFCEMVSHDPFFLLGRKGLLPENHVFQLSDLPRLKFASVSEVPTPWMCLQHDLRELGLDPSHLDHIANRSMVENYAALCAGDIDVVQVFEPFPSIAQKDGTADLLYTASARGPTVYTAFIASRDAAGRHRDAFAAVTRATADMQRWLYSHPSDDLAAATASFFPDVPADILARALRRYRDNGLWARDPAMSKQGFDRLAQSLYSGGFIARLPDFDSCVENSF